MWLSRIEKIVPEKNEIIIETRSWGYLIVPPDHTFGYFLFGEILHLANKINTLDPSLNNVLLSYQLTGALEVPSSFENLVKWEITKKGTYLWSPDFGPFSNEVTAGNDGNLCHAKLIVNKSIDLSLFLNLKGEIIEAGACIYSSIDTNQKLSQHKPSDKDL